MKLAPDVEGTGLARKSGRPFESHPGLDTIPGVLETRDGTRLRTLITRPSGTRQRLPAILFVPWLSCDSIELRAEAEDGWTRMLRRVARESGMVMMRTEKRGVGDSEGGPCSRLDYLTELSDHRAALDQLARSEFVDPRRIVVYGASMGGNMAPLVALDRQVAGIIVWGGGARTWFERMLAFEGNRRELLGRPNRTAEMNEVAAFLHHYLLEGKTPRQIAEEVPTLAQAWSHLTGTEGDTHYGRPIAFHHQAQRQDWAGAWARLDAPALVLYGEYDWYEEAESHALIAHIVGRSHPQHTRFRIIERTDHHFMRFSRPEEAASDSRGVANEGPVVEEIIGWLKAVVGR